MAAFSYQPPPSFSNIRTSIKMGESPTNFFQFCPPEPKPLGYGVDVFLPGDETSSPIKQSSDSSTVVDRIESGEQVSPNINSKEEKRKKRNPSVFGSVQLKNKPKRRGVKQKKQKEEEKNEKEVSEEAQTNYIHVRARRGQATDSHSLAERLRREKISQRMKMLQGLVPSCDKVIGKSLVLDEIINYVQSLQNQVEFLSMKLTSVKQLHYQFETQMDSFMVNPESISSSMASSNLQQCTGFSSHVSNFPFKSRVVLFQDDLNLMWEGEDLEQKFLKSSALSQSL